VAAWLGLRFGAGRPVERSQAPSTIAVPATASALAAWARITPPHYEAPSLRGSGWESSEFEAAMQRYVVSDYPSAAAGLERAVRRHPDDAAALFFLGACDLLIDRTPDGIRRLQEVVALGESPYVEEAHILLAKGLVREGRVDEAAAELQKALALRGDLEDEARQGLRRIRESRPRGE
jgi:tetratricopeptide (TPR) repeat protein